MNQVVNAKRRYLKEAYEKWRNHQRAGDPSAFDIDLVDRIIEEASALK